MIELFKIDMETQKDNPQGNASLAGAEFTWKYYAGFYNKMCIRDRFQTGGNTMTETKNEIRVARNHKDRLFRMISVSYTHLDVYKRQVLSQE